MPTRIQEGVECTEKCLAAEREIAVKYPDAYRTRIVDGGDWVWMSESVDKDVSDIDIIVSTDTGARPVVCFYTTVLGMRVYARDVQTVATSLYRLKLQKPAEYAEFVDFLFRL
jgi:hypothetical protein